MAERPKFQRVLLKISGEALGAADGRGLDPKRTNAIARQVAEISRAGVQLAIVIGGGNIVRGSDVLGTGMDPAVADTMGMLATVINGLALQDALERLKVDTRLQTAIPMHAAAEPYIRRRCLRHLDKGRVVILAGGTGSPHFTTDTAAALRACEIGAQVLLKATNVDGVYSDDPRKNAKAKRLKRLTYEDVLHKNLRVMDLTAVTLCRERKIPIIVFNVGKPGNIRRAVFGKTVGTSIRGR